MTLRLAERLPPEIWEPAARYIKSYARLSRWNVRGLSHKRGYIQFNVEYVPPMKQRARKPRPEPRPASPETSK